MTSRRWMWMTLGLTFLLGMSLGISVDRFLLDPHQNGRSGNGHRDRRHRQGLVAWLDRELDLTPEQESELEALRGANRKKARAFWTEYQESHELLRQEFRQQIRSLLTSEQTQRFNALILQMDERRRKRDR